eukprot:1085614-Karenia_brevis.AAC.1
MSHLSSVMRQWVPIAKFICITALIHDEQQFITQPSSIIEGLCKYWSPIFDGTSSVHNAELAMTALQNLPTPSWDWSKLRLPDFRSFSRLLFYSQDNSPGYDGLPFSAHNSVSGTSAALMDSMFTELRNFNSEDPIDMHEFNYLVQACIPKKISLPYENGVACRSEETRSLSCKCTDNKTILKATAQSINAVVAVEACTLQQGFIPGRYFTNNVIVIDTVSRIYSNNYARYGDAVSAYFDFGNAFPSVSIAWIFLVLEWLQAPRGIINLVRATYHEVHMYIKHAGRTQFMCMVQSGVLQGCPLAALLFVLAMEPFLQLFDNSIIEAGLGIVRACADDIAITLKSLYSLLHVFKIFYLAEFAAGLTLKTKNWQSFNVVATAEYLGIWMGPAASTKNWVPQIAKLLDRTHLINSSAAPTSVAIGTYNIKGITVLSYPSQFLPPPPNLRLIEKHAYTKILK